MHQPAFMSGNDNNCIAFLQWALPHLQLRWPGYRKVRRQVCRRIESRIIALKLSGYQEYRSYLESHTGEWKVLEPLTRISISRFFRDPKTWEILKEQLLPELSKRALEENRTLHCWSAGCASGEEPYSMALLWHHHLQEKFPGMALDLLATDASQLMLDRAHAACFPKGSLKFCPKDWLERSFSKQHGEYCLDHKIRDMVVFSKEDIREQMPTGPFDLVFCKNVVGMYYTENLALDIYRKICARIRQGGILLLGNHEPFPLEYIREMALIAPGLNIYAKRG
jgi:chemotaxis protein methyltransferase CheR